jgi:hypothetical protein
MSEEMSDDLPVGHFVKLYGSIVVSSVWSESTPTRIVWLTMLAIADPNGGVAASVPGLARVANVTVAECEAAIKALSEPDPYSKTPDHEGRRIRAVAGGWLVFNYKLYRELRTPKQVAEAERKADYRERQRKQDSAGQSRLSHAEVEVDVEAEVIQKSPLSPARAETDDGRAGRSTGPDPAWPEPVMEFLARRGEGLGAWTAAFVGMLGGLGAPAGKAVTVEQIAQACIEIEQLGGEITPRRFRRVLEQIVVPLTGSGTGGARKGSEDAEFVAASNRLQEIASYRDPVRSQSLTAEGWKQVTPAERAALKAIGTVERVLTARPNEWPFVVRDYLKATRGAGSAKAPGKPPPRAAG